MTVLYLVACGAIFWSAFCRLVLMHGATQKRVRARFVLLGGAAGFGVASALFGGHRARRDRSHDDGFMPRCRAGDLRRPTGTSGVPTEYLLDPGQ